MKVCKIPNSESQNSNLLLVFENFDEERPNGTKYQNMSRIDQKINEKTLRQF